jgi:hypothetical protein
MRHRQQIVGEEKVESWHREATPQCPSAGVGSVWASVALALDDRQ